MGSSSFDLHDGLSRFRAFAGTSTAFGRVESLAFDIVRFVPAEPTRLRIGFLALVHGNEIIGLPILNSLLEDLLSGRLKTKHEIYFGLGNLPAAHAQKRFLERDLNRCFGQTAADTPEARRARELEEFVLNRVDYLIDLHQTVHASQQPFFIFQYSSPNCFRHLSLMNRELMTILQFDAIGEGQSLSTDEYLRGRGRFGVALELGQKGWSKELFDLGRATCARFLANVASFASFADAENIATKRPATPFFEIADRLNASADDSALDPHWSNFAKFEEGQVLGRVGDEALIADQSGFMLFPKPGQSVDRGTTMFHICRPLNAEKLEALAGLAVERVNAELEVQA